MSRHEGVSCDSCLKGNFRGRRYKCLICYDYDLCATCYEAGAATTRHTIKHPIQCILTRTDFDLYYGGEALPAEQHQSFTCPQCGKMGFTELLLQEHVAAEHSNMCTEVVCPICAAVPGGDPNHVTDDFNTHLTMEHRTPREFDEPTGIRHVRRIPHPSRGVGSTRTRRANMHFPSGGAALAGLPPSGRETMDPIAELLSQLSSVRNRAAAAQSVSSQLQQLEIQLQNTRQQLERLPRRQAEVSKPTATSAGRGSVGDPVSGSNSNTSASNSQFLLSRCSDSPASDSEQQVLEHERVDRSLFVQELILSTLTGQLQQHDELDLSSLSVEQSATVPSQAAAKDAKPAVTTKKSAPPQSKTTRPKSVSNSSQPLPRAAATVSHSGSTGRSMSNHVNSSPLNSFGSNSGQGAGPGSNSGSGLGPAATHSRPAAGSMRDARVNPSTSKRTMLKHLESNKTAEKEPPPH